MRGLFCSHGVTCEDLRGLDGPLRRRASLCGVQHQSQDVRVRVSPRLAIKANTDGMYLLMGRMYDLAIFTYFFAFAHFGSELLIFRTATFGPGALSPVVVSSESAPRCKES